VQLVPEASYEIDVVVVSGADAGGYLQTQLTQDVLSIDVGGSAWSFLLTPKSEIIALMLVNRSAPNEYKLEVDAGWGDTVRRIMDELLGRMDISFDQTTKQIEAPDEQARITAGWPRMGSEIVDGVTPAMTGIVPVAVSFDKGCYTGQEFVARVHFRDAAPPKRLVRIAFDDEIELPVGADIDVDGETVGSVTSAARGVALGFLKRSIATPAHADIASESVELLDLGPPSI
jgi:folate-binding protein YgfZ